MRKFNKDDISYFLQGLRKKKATCPYCESKPIVYAKKYIVIDICNCQNCKLFFVNPSFLMDQDVREFYDDFYASDATLLPVKKDIEIMKRNNFQGCKKDYNDRLTVIRKLALGNQLLEFGSSWGYFIFQSQAYGFAPTGIEISSKRAAFGRTHLGVNILPNIILTHEQFDVICSFHTLEHLLNLKEIFDMFYEKLLPGGSLILEVPNFDPEIKGKSVYSIIGKVHPLGFSKQFFENNLPRHGFSEINIAGTYEDLLKKEPGRLSLKDVIIVHAKKSGPS